VGILWIDAPKQSPIKFASEDGALTVEWKSFQPGPQDAALFEPPAGYRIINDVSDPSKPYLKNDMAQYTGVPNFK
jgi:hypothetical protein